VIRGKTQKISLVKQTAWVHPMMSAVAILIVVFPISSHSLQSSEGAHELYD